MALSRRFPHRQPPPFSPSLPLPLSLSASLSLSLLLLSSFSAPCRGIRGVRERIHLAEATGEVNPRVDRVEFDPLIAELEQEQDDQKWMEKYKKMHAAWTGRDENEEGAEEGAGQDAGYLDMDDMGQADPVSSDFLYDDHLNITDRIIKLFPQIDSSPADGQLSMDEMVAWHVKLGKWQSLHRTEREMEAADADSDGQATLLEALSVLGMGDPNDESIAEERAALVERFQIADTNNDSVLNMTEFNDFLHPEESDNPGLIVNLLKNEMRHRDLDSDGKMNVDEFEMTTHHEVEHLMNELKDPAAAMQEHWDLELHDNPEKAKAHKEAAVKGSFASFDKDADGFIDLQEFRSIVQELWPSQKDFAFHHAKDLFQQADADKDGFLTVEEMLHHPHAFYETVEDHGQQQLVHDEF